LRNKWGERGYITFSTCAFGFERKHPLGVVGAKITGTLRGSTSHQIVEMREETVRGIENSSRWMAPEIFIALFLEHVSHLMSNNTGSGYQLTISGFFGRGLSKSAYPSGRLSRI